MELQAEAGGPGTFLGGGYGGSGSYGEPIQIRVPTSKVYRILQTLLHVKTFCRHVNFFCVCLQGWAHNWQRWRNYQKHAEPVRGTHPG